MRSLRRPIRILRWQEGPGYPVPVRARPIACDLDKGPAPEEDGREPKSRQPPQPPRSWTGLIRANRAAWAWMLLLLLQCMFVHAQATNSVPHPATRPASGPDFSSFKILTERNIFDPNRSGRSPRGSAAPSRQPKVQTFALVGVLASEKGRIAFFDGSSADYKKALHVAGSIANYKVKEIAPNYVKLDLDGKETRLAVGMQMRREDEGEWRPMAGTAASLPSSPPPTESAGPADEDNGVLRKLMQKREQELNK
jgi:hypothetical protein